MLQETGQPVNMLIISVLFVVFGYITLHKDSEFMWSPFPYSLDMLYWGRQSYDICPTANIITPKFVDNIQQGLDKIFEKMSSRKIMWNLESARLVVWISGSLWNLTAAETPVKCLSDQTILDINLRVSRHIITRRIGYWNGSQNACLVPCLALSVHSDCKLHHNSSLQRYVIERLTCVWVSIWVFAWTQWTSNSLWSPTSNLVLYSIKDQPSYHYISGNIEAVRSGMWQGFQQCNQTSCQIAEQFDHYNAQYRGLEISRVK